MRLDKCEICKLSITDFDHQIVIGYGIPELQYSLCPACARPIIDFLERHRLPSFPEANSVFRKDGSLEDSAELKITSSK